MRSDMHKVVVEHPRWNPGPGKHGRRADLSDELLPKFEGIKRPHAHRKGLTDLLGLLKRWLHSQAGRSWNDVYSEASVFSRCECIVHFQPQPSTKEVAWQIKSSIKTVRFFEIPSKRRKGFPSEAQVKRGFRVVRGDKELREKLGRNDPCPCGSGRSF